MNWRKITSRNTKWRSSRARNIRLAAVAAAIFFGAVPAWPQNEGATAPNPANAFARSGNTGSVAQHLRPQAAQATPRRERHTPRVRAYSSRKSMAAAAAPPAAPEVTESTEWAWPSAQENVGASGLIPVVVRTVREMVEPHPEMPAVHANELSDIDLAAAPVENRHRIATTDGRADADEEPRGFRFAAFVENARAVGSIVWLEPVLLVLAAAIAAVAAGRVFAF